MYLPIYYINKKTINNTYKLLKYRNNLNVTYKTNFKLY